MTFFLEKIQKIRTSLIDGTRNKAILREVFYSFIIKIVSVITGVLLVPILIDSLGNEHYGVWLTLSSIFSWFAFFDIGLGNGMRNKVSEAIAKDQLTLAKEYVSTTYAIVSLIFGVVIVVFLLINNFLDWQTILNIKIIAKDELLLITSVVFTLFLFRFIFQLVGVLYIANHKPSINNLFFTLGNLIAFIIVLFIHSFSEGNILLYGTVITGVPLIILIIANIYAFNFSFKFLSPSLKSIKLHHVHLLLGLGGKFFVIQLSAILLFSTANLFISQLFNANEVVVYNAAFMYYQMPIMVFSIIMSPIWSSVTEAYAREDFEWLNATLKRLNQLSYLFILGIIIMTFISPWVYQIWLGQRVKIPLALSISMALFAILNIYLSPYTSFVNGIGKMKLTLIIVITGSLIYLPLAYVLSKTLNSSAGIVLATCIVNGIGLYFQPVQVNKLINKKFGGIWDK